MRSAGVDLSYAQESRRVDYSTLMRVAQFAILKASQSDYYDYQFLYHWPRMAETRRPLGIYHYLTPHRPGRVQARTFMNSFERVGTPSDLSIPPAVDVECALAPTFPRSTWMEIVLEFVGAVRQRWGWQCMIYTRASYWNPTFAGMDVAWVRNHPLWVAQYPFGSRVLPPSAYDRVKPIIPRGWTTWSIWQVSEVSRWPGYSRNLDMDISNGPIDHLVTEWAERRVHGGV